MKTMLGSIEFAEDSEESEFSWKKEAVVVEWTLGGQAGGGRVGGGRV